MTICDNFMTFYDIFCPDNLRHFMTFSVPSPSSRPLLDFAGSHCSSCEMPFWEWDFSFRESLSELQEPLSKSIPQLSQSSENDLSTLRALFRGVGVVPRLLMRLTTSVCWQAFLPVHVAVSSPTETTYRSIQIDHRQTSFLWEIHF